MNVLLLCCALLVFAACAEETSETPEPVADTAEAVEPAPAPPRSLAYSEERAACDHYTESRIPLFGDLHVHTNFSFDAAANTIGQGPVDAHRFAKGDAIRFWPLDDEGNPAGTYTIDRPLDFLAVTDHGEFLGERRLCHEEGSPSYDSSFCQATREEERQSMMLFGSVITTETPSRIPEVCGEDGALCRDFALEPWKEMARAAKEAYDTSASCDFTSFVAYEYTGTPGTSNYHRNVIFRNDNVPALPVSYIDAPYDSLLWEKLDAACRADDGCDYITIPHNSNLANGRMAPYMRLEKTIENRRAYAAKRLDREPIMEIFQHKGASECVNGLTSVLSEPDELCDVEAVRFIGREETYSTQVIEGSELVLGTATEVTEECGDEVGANGMVGAGCVHATDYHRSGLVVGLAEEQEIGVNPVKLGAIGSTDTHAATPGAAVESDWRGHVSVEATPLERLTPGLLTSGIDGNPGGLAGVWAVENSRDAIFDAMERREVFGTTGPRIVRRSPGRAVSGREARVRGFRAPRSGLGGDSPPAAPTRQGMGRRRGSTAHLGHDHRRRRQRSGRRSRDRQAVRRRTRQPLRRAPRRHLRRERPELLLRPGRGEPDRPLDRARLHAHSRRRAPGRLLRRLLPERDPGDGLDVAGVVQALSRA
jgi:hypothetical protein